ncbi:MAG: hypothetical protein KDD33_03775 [Bdellovibrionales bacterium]|nr:hypothetical protein [Bdellovibrionales bacterium]
MRELTNKFAAYSRVVTCLVMTTLLLSCTNKKKTVNIQEINRPLTLVRKAVEYSLTGGLLKMSRNNRVYFSKYHKPGTDLNQAPGTSLRRAQVIIAILNGRRPYIVEVAYRIEKYANGGFVLSHYDQGLAKRYRDLVDEYLASRPEGGDLIDDFRVY